MLGACWCWLAKRALTFRLMSDSSFCSFPPLFFPPLWLRKAVFLWQHHLSCGQMLDQLPFLKTVERLKFGEVNTGVWAPCFCWHRPGGWRPCCLLFGGRSHLCLWGASRSLRSGCVDPCVAGTLSLQWRTVPWGSLYWQVRLLLNT